MLEVLRTIHPIFSQDRTLLHVDWRPRNSTAKSNDSTMGCMVVVVGGGGVRSEGDDAGLLGGLSVGWGVFVWWWPGMEVMVHTLLLYLVPVDVQPALGPPGSWRRSWESRGLRQPSLPSVLRSQGRCSPQAQTHPPWQLSRGSMQVQVNGMRERSGCEGCMASRGVGSTATYCRARGVANPSTKSDSVGSSASSSSTWMMKSTISSNPRVAAMIRGVSPPLAGALMSAPPSSTSSSRTSALSRSSSLMPTYLSPAHALHVWGSGGGEANEHAAATLHGNMRYGRTPADRKV